MKGHATIRGNLLRIMEAPFLRCLFPLPSSLVHKDGLHGITGLIESHRTTGQPSHCVAHAYTSQGTQAAGGKVTRFWERMNCHALLC